MACLVPLELCDSPRHVYFLRVAVKPSKSVCWHLHPKMFPGKSLAVEICCKWCYCISKSGQLHWSEEYCNCLPIFLLELIYNQTKPFWGDFDQMIGLNGLSDNTEK